MDKIIDAVRSEINTALGLTVTVGSLPPTGGVSVEPQGGFAPECTNDREQIHELTLLFLAKNQSQKTACDNLWSICNRLTAKTTYPVAVDTDCAWVLSKTATPPQYIGREDNRQHIYSCVVTIKIHQH